MKVIQILGLFNSGTNLLYSILNEIFDVYVGAEGHTLFWKHTVIGKNFARKHIKPSENTFYLIVTKNPYFQFHSFKKSPYSIKLKKHRINQLSLDAFVDKPLCIMLPKGVITDLSTLNFNHCPHYWNKFHMSAFKNLPPKNTIIIKYEDLLFNTNAIISELTKFFPLKNQYLNETYLRSTIDGLLNKPSKSSGQPRFGNTAKQFYSSNVHALYNKDTLSWITSQLNKDIMDILHYDVIS
jgi:hypothetical protein